MRNEIRVGTRASRLAVAQTRQFCEALSDLHPELLLTEKRIVSEGDGTTTALSVSPTSGVFVSALREALLNHQVDFIVHSMKDVPVTPHLQILTACVPRRADARDVLVSRSGLALSKLPAGARVGTSSPRRAARLRHMRSDLEIVNIRGNIDSRIEQVQQGKFDATLLARAGLNRLGRALDACEIFETNEFVPAPGQGALSVECRAGDTDLYRILRELNDDETELLTTAERAVLAELRAGCATPVGATAQRTNDTLTLTAELANEHTGEYTRTITQAVVDLGDLRSAAQLGVEAASELRNSRIMSTVTHTFSTATAPVVDQPVLLVRGTRNESDAHALEECGVPTLCDPHLRISTYPNPGGVLRILAALRSPVPSWFVVTSTNALVHLERQLAPGKLTEVLTASTHHTFAAIGAQTRRELVNRGVLVVRTPVHATFESLTELIHTSRAAPVIIPSGSFADTSHDEALQQHGCAIIRECVYRTEAVIAAPVTSDALRQRAISAVLFRSPSAVQAFVALHGRPTITVFCVGAATACRATELGLTVAGDTEHPDPPIVARMIATTLAVRA